MKKLVYLYSTLGYSCKKVDKCLHASVISHPVAVWWIDLAPVTSFFSHLSWVNRFFFSVTKFLQHFVIMILNRGYYKRKCKPSLLYKFTQLCCQACFWSLVLFFFRGKWGPSCGSACLSCWRSSAVQSRTAILVVTVRWRAMGYLIVSVLPGWTAEAWPGDPPCPFPSHWTRPI